MMYDSVKNIFIKQDINDVLFFIFKLTPNSEKSYLNFIFLIIPLILIVYLVRIFSLKKCNKEQFEYIYLFYFRIIMFIYVISGFCEIYISFTKFFQFFHLRILAYNQFILNHNITQYLNLKTNYDAIIY